MVVDETRLLARLIDDLRTLANAESGTLNLKKEPTDGRGPSVVDFEAAHSTTT
jgi:hypothetical protein